MRFPGYAIVLVLAVLFLAGIATRVNRGSDSPYFEGTSAMNYRHATLVADGERLDVPTHKSNFPEGYTPARYRTDGWESATGRALRVGRFFGVTDGVRFMRRLTAVVFSLTAIALFILVYELWQCQAAALLAAFLVAFLGPLADATGGTVFDHGTPAAFLATVHAAALLRLRSGRAWPALVAALVAATGLLAVWEGGVYYVALATGALALLAPANARRVTVAVALHGAVAVVAALVVPYLSAVRAVASWPVALTLACVAYRVLGSRVPRGWRGAAAVVAGAMVLTVLMSPLRAGAGFHVSLMETLGYRWRHLGGKPLSPSALPDAVRYLWPLPITAHTALTMFLPLGALAVAAVMASRAIARERRVALAVAGTAAAAAVVAVGFDRAQLPIATVAIIAAVSLAVRGISQASRVRAAFVIVGAYLVLAETVFPDGTMNPSFVIARQARVAFRDPYSFLRVSMENTDASLLRFVATRTSVKDRILGRPDHTALLLAFGGRTAVLAEGARSDAAAEKEIDMLKALYGDIDALHDRCLDAGITYVLYSVDLLLDTTPYSKRYLAGLTQVAPESAVYRMNFAAGQLHGFTLVFENENFRLFKVTETPEPTFITDHPPVYHHDVFERVGRDIDAFHRRIIELTATYTDALRSSERGDMEGALKKLGWCLTEAPRFTLARIAAATTLAQMGRLEDARKTIMAVLGYAPDNAAALYQAAYILARLEDAEGARKYLDLLFALGTDSEVVERGRLLESFLDQGIPVGPGMLPQ